MRKCIRYKYKKKYNNENLRRDQKASRTRDAQNKKDQSSKTPLTSEPLNKETTN